MLVVFKKRCFTHRLNLIPAFSKFLWHSHLFLLWFDCQLSIRNIVYFVHLQNFSINHFLRAHCTLYNIDVHGFAFIDQSIEKINPNYFIHRFMFKQWTGIWWNNEFSAVNKLISFYCLHHQQRLSSWYRCYHCS